MIMKLVMLFIFCVLFLYLRRSQLNQPLKMRGEASDNHSYHAIEILASDSSCACAHKLNGERILSREFNKRVLHQCDKTICSCHFRHFSDRRNGLDRRINRMVFNPHPGSYGRRRDDVHNKARFRLATDESTNQSLAGTV